MQQTYALRETFSTSEAAKLLNRKPATLRRWACFKQGPIQPIRINSRLAWPADQIAALLNGGANG